MAGKTEDYIRDVELEMNKKSFLEENPEWELAFEILEHFDVPRNQPKGGRPWQEVLKRN